jgi:hypothetical protein
MRHPVRMVIAPRLRLPLALAVLALGATAPGHSADPAPICTPARAAPAGDARPALPPAPRATAPPGALLFSDDFRTLDAWRSDRAGVWSVADGVLRGHPPDGKQERSFLFAGSEDWRDYAVDVDVCQMRGVDKGVAVCVRGGHGVAVDLRGGDYQDVLLYRQEVPLGSARVANRDSAWHHLRIEIREARYTVLVNGARVLERRDPLRAMRQGRIALAAYTGGRGECSVLYANLFVTRLGPAR